MCENVKNIKRLVPEEKLFNKSKEKLTSNEKKHSKIIAKYFETFFMQTQHQFKMHYKHIYLHHSPHNNIAATGKYPSKTKHGILRALALKTEGTNVKSLSNNYFIGS